MKTAAENRIKFTKMQGCGNDYIYIDCFDGEPENPSALAVKLSDRHFSIGGDGVILVCKSDVADAKMRMFNADGSEGKMCGNGIRCVAKFVHDNRLSDKNPLKFETLSGIKEIKLTLDGAGRVCSALVDMGAPILAPEKIPSKFSGENAVNVPLFVDRKRYGVTAVSMGNPHCVTFVDDDFDLAGFDIEKIGRKFENHEFFPERVNTEFVKVISDRELMMRVWERGSGETLACGTGACAVAVAACLCGYCSVGEPITVRLRGGNLIITYTGDTVLMEGPCEVAFEGTVEL